MSGASLELTSPGGREARRVVLSIPLRPMGRPKPRVRAFLGDDGRPRAYLYPDPKASSWQREVKAFAQQLAAEVVRNKLRGALWLRLLIVLPRPRSMVWKTRPMPPEFAPVKPDGDNVQGMIQDALQGLLFAGDQQIVKWTGEKVYAAGPGYGDTRPRVEISLEEL